MIICQCHMIIMIHEYSYLCMSTYCHRIFAPVSMHVIKMPCLSVHQQHDLSSIADLQGLSPLPEIRYEKVKSLVLQSHLWQVTLALTIKNCELTQDTCFSILLTVYHRSSTRHITPLLLRYTQHLARPSWSREGQSLTRKHYRHT